MEDYKFAFEFGIIYFWIYADLPLPYMPFSPIQGKEIHFRPVSKTLKTSNNSNELTKLNLVSYGEL